MNQNTASVLNAMNTLRDQKKGGMPHQLFTGVLMVVFLIILLLALAIGVSVYKRVADIQMETSEDRLALELIANYVRANDGTGSVMVGTGPEGRALVLVEALDTGSYETRIYLYNNSIVEEYSVSGTPYTPGKAMKLVDSSKFSFSYDNDLLTIVTDQGSADVALRSKQGGV